VPLEKEAACEGDPVARRAIATAVVFKEEGAREGDLAAFKAAKARACAVEEASCPQGCSPVVTLVGCQRCSARAVHEVLPQKR